MKNHSILSLLIFLLGFGITTSSCEDMLTPDLDRYTEGFSGTDTVYFYLGIVRNVQDMVEQNMLLQDIRSDLADTTLYTTDSIANIATYNREEDGENGLLNRAAYYKVINQCNYYLTYVDTAAVKNNIYYMRKEYAQVEAIRAWAYMQLVLTYGTVPFITQPVEDANTGWETNPEAWATADNLIDLLKDGLEMAQTYEHSLGYPAYEEFNTGNVYIDAEYMLFYNDLILGDLYLLRGASRDDYVEAAKNYYYFLYDRMGDGYGTGSSVATVTQTRSMASNGKKTYTYSSSSWINGFFAAESLNDENLTVIPSAANSSFGRVMTSLVEIYGFEPHSTNTTTTTEAEDDDDEDETETSGTVTLSPNYKIRQIGPSQAYLNLCAAQTYSEPEFGGDSNTELTDIEYYSCGDARQYGTVPTIQASDGTKAQFITKDAPTSGQTSSTRYVSSADFKYYKSLYRMRQVYLRYAEAINRAGYPRLAFCVLRNGLDYEKLPTIADSTVTAEDGTKTKVYYLDSATVTNAANYVNLEELQRMEADADYSSYLDFTSSRWENTGIHEFGCGTSSNLDSLYSYEETVAQRVEDEASRLNNGVVTESAAKKAANIRAGRSARADEDSDEEETTTTVTEADEDEINAVETLICDECALEMAFEGTRMGDLIRFARHKNYADGTGTEWLAWKISRRSLDLEPYEETSTVDTRLYNLLLDEDNWYIMSPEY